jgi:hypothetical protein
MGEYRIIMMPGEVLPGIYEKDAGNRHSIQMLVIYASSGV